MAEIKIEKKKMVWPWMLAGAGIIALLLLYFIYYRDNGDASLQSSTPAFAGRANEPVIAFTSYADSDTTTMGLDHNYTHTALIKLATATQYLAENTNYQVNEKIKNAKDLAELITNDPSATTHANHIREAAVLLSGILQNIQKASYPKLAKEAELVSASAEAIDTDELTLNQKNRVRTFFNNASMLLKTMVK